MRPTREGKRFFLATILIAVAAVNTGNNLIYLILSLMVSFLIISLVAVKINLSRLSLGVAAEHPIFAGEESLIKVSVLNNKSYIPSYSIRILSPGGSRSSYFAYIPPGGSITGETGIFFPRRGLYHYGDFRAESGFPFILLSAKKKIKVEGEVLVYPARVDMTEAAGLLPSGPGGSGAAGRAGSGDEIFSIREFRYGDDWRKIHWKASAKAEGLLVREYAESEVMRMTLLVDNLDTSGTGADIPPGSKRAEGSADELFEKTVSVSGSLAKHFLDRGFHVRVVTCRKVIPFGSGDEHLFKVLDILALIRSEGRCDNALPIDEEGPAISIVRSLQYSSSPFAAAGDAVIYADTV